MALAVIGAIVDLVAGSIAESLTRRTVTPLEYLQMRGGGVFLPTTEEGVRLTFIDPATGRIRTGLLDVIAPGALEELAMPVGREFTRTMDTPMPQVGVPGPQMMTLPPIAGATEFTASVGSPRMEPRVMVFETPRNVQTPADGRPGGSFNYNALLTSRFKWDFTASAFTVNPGIGFGVASLFLTRPGIYACEWIVSADTPVALTNRQIISNVGRDITNYWVSDQASVFQDILIYHEPPATGTLSSMTVVASSAGVQNIATTMRAKMLASL